MPWWPHLHYYWVKSYFCYPSKRKLPAIFADSKQSKTPFGETPWLTGRYATHWSLCFLLSPCYLQETMPCQWSSSNLPRVLRIWESVFYSQEFFTLHSFLLVSRTPWGWQFNLKVSKASCWSLKHSSDPTISLNHNNPQKGL